MKKIISLFVLSGLLLALSGCAEADTQAAATTSGTAGSGLLSAGYENALPIQLQLVVGTLKLDGTENEVDAATAKNLLPLWKAARSLSSSDTTAPQELEALFEQIQETMTPAQVEAIAAMRLTQADMAQIGQEIGMNFGSGGLTPEMQATMQARRESGQGFPGAGGPDAGGPGGGFPGGGSMPVPPDGNGFPGGGAGSITGGLSSGVRARAGAGSSIFDAVIKYLEEKLSG